MYYKIKVNKNNLEVIGTVKRAKFNDGFLYLTEEEINKLNPLAVKNYNFTKDKENNIEKTN